jgi:hypothetical protein
MYFRRKTSAGRAYLQIVESRRDGDQVRQQVIATLGVSRSCRRAASWSGWCARPRDFAAEHAEALCTFAAPGRPRVARKIQQESENNVALRFRISAPPHQQNQ